MDNQEVAKNLIRLRQLHNWTQDDLSIKLKISRQAVSKWETGVALPNIDILLTLSKLYNISINEIIEPSECKLLSNFEELPTVGLSILKEYLEDTDQEQIIIASIGASPETAQFIEDVFPDIDFTLERERVGRIQITKVENAQAEIIRQINQCIV